MIGMKIKEDGNGFIKDWIIGNTLSLIGVNEKDGLKIKEHHNIGFKVEGVLKPDSMN